MGNKFKGTINWLVKLIFENWIKSLVGSSTIIGIFAWIFRKFFTYSYSFSLPVWGIISVISILFISILFNFYFAYIKRKQNKDKKVEVFGLDWVLTSNFFSTFLSCKDISPDILHNIIKGPFCYNCGRAITEINAAEPLTEINVQLKETLENTFNILVSSTSPKPFRHSGMCPKCKFKFESLPSLNVEKLREEVYEEMRAHEVKKKKRYKTYA